LGLASRFAAAISFLAAAAAAAAAFLAATASFLAAAVSAFFLVAAAFLSAAVGFPGLDFPFSDEELSSSLSESGSPSDESSLRLVASRSSVIVSSPHTWTPRFH